MDNKAEVTCPQCQQRYAKGERCPRSLFCGHTFCTSCLDQVIASGSRQCPTCSRAFFSLSASQLPTDFTLLKQATSTPSASVGDRFSYRSSSNTYSSPFRPLILSSSPGLDKSDTSSTSSTRSFQLPLIGKSSYISPLTSSVSKGSNTSDIYSKSKASSTARETESSYADAKTTEEDASSGDASSKTTSSLSYKLPSIRSPLSTRDQKGAKLSGGTDKETSEGMSGHNRLKQTTSLPLTSSALRASAPSVAQIVDKEESLAASSISRTDSDSALSRSLSSPYTSLGRDASNHSSSSSARLSIKDTSYNTLSSSLSSLTPRETPHSRDPGETSHSRGTLNSSFSSSRREDDGRYTSHSTSMNKNYTDSSGPDLSSESSITLNKLDTKLQSPPSKGKLYDEVDHGVLGWKMSSSILSSKSRSATSDKNQTAKTSSGTPSHVLKMCRSIAHKSRPAPAAPDDNLPDTPHPGDHDNSLTSRATTDDKSDKKVNWDSAADASRSSLTSENRGDVAISSVPQKSAADVAKTSMDSTDRENRGGDKVQDTDSSAVSKSETDGPLPTGDETSHSIINQKGTSHERMQSSSRSYNLDESYSSRSFTKYSSISTSSTSTSSRLYTRSRGLETEEETPEDAMGDKQSLNQENSPYQSYSSLSRRLGKSEDKTTQEKVQDEDKSSPSASLGARLRGRTSYLSSADKNPDEVNKEDISAIPGRRTWARSYRGNDSDESKVKSSTQSGSLSSRLSSRTSYLSQDLKDDGTNITDYRRGATRDGGEDAKSEDAGGQRQSRLSFKTNHFSQELNDDGTTDYRTQRSAAGNESEETKSDATGGQRRSFSSMWKMKKELEEETGNRESKREEAKDPHETGETSTTRRKWLSSRITDKYYGDYKGSDSLDEGSQPKQDNQEHVKATEDKDTTRREWKTSTNADRYNYDYKADSHLPDSHTSLRKYNTSRTQKGLDKVKGESESLKNEADSEYPKGRTVDRDNSPEATSTPHSNKTKENPLSSQLLSSSSTKLDRDEIQESQRESRRREYNSSDYKSEENRLSSDLLSKTTPSEARLETPIEDSEAEIRIPRFRSNRTSREAFSLTDYHSMLLRRLPTNEEIARKAYDRFLYRQASRELESEPYLASSQQAKDVDETDGRSRRVVTEYSVLYKADKTEDKDGDTDIGSEYTGRHKTKDCSTDSKYGDTNIGSEHTERYKAKEGSTDSKYSASDRITEHLDRYKSYKVKSEGEATRDKKWQSETDRGQRNSTSTGEISTKHDHLGSLSRNSATKPDIDDRDTFDAGRSGWGSVTRQADHSTSQRSGRNQSDQSGAASVPAATQKDRTESVRPSRLSYYTEMLSELKIGSVSSTQNDDEEGQDVVDQNESNENNHKESSMESTKNDSNYTERRNTTQRSYDTAKETQRSYDTTKTQRSYEKYQSTADSTHSSLPRSTRWEDKTDNRERTHYTNTQTSHSKYHSTADTIDNSGHQDITEEDEADEERKDISKMMSGGENDIGKAKTNSGEREDKKAETNSENDDRKAKTMSGGDESEIGKANTTRGGESEAHDILTRARLRLARYRERDAKEKQLHTNEESEKVGKERKEKETKEMKEKKKDKEKKDKEKKEMKKEAKEKEKKEKEKKEPKEKKETEENKETKEDSEHHHHHHHHHLKSRFPRYRKHHHEIRKKEEEKDVGLELRNARSKLRTTIDTSPPRNRTPSSSFSKTGQVRSSLKEEENERHLPSSVIQDGEPSKNEGEPAQSVADERKVNETRKTKDQDHSLSKSKNRESAQSYGDKRKVNEKRMSRDKDHCLQSGNSHGTQYDDHAKERADDSSHANVMESEGASSLSVNEAHGYSEAFAAAGIEVLMPGPGEQQGDYMSFNTGEDVIDFSHEGGPPPAVGVCRRHGMLLNKYCTRCEQWACDRCLRKHHLQKHGCHVISAQDAVSHMKLTHSAYLTSRVNTLEAFREQLRKIVTHCDQSMREHQANMEHLQLKLHEEQTLLEGIQSMKNLALQKWQQVDYWETLLEESADRITQSSSSEEVMSAVQSATSTILARVMDGAAPL